MITRDSTILIEFEEYLKNQSSSGVVNQRKWDTYEPNTRHDLAAHD